MQAEPASAIKSAKGKRYRLPDSDCSVDELVTVLTKWFEREGTRCIPTLLDTVTKLWPARGMPSAHLLCLSAAYGFALLLSAVDSTLHPRHAKLTAAILDVHSKEPCFAGGPERSEVRAMMFSKTLLCMLSKYRDLVTYATKAITIRRTSNIDQWGKISLLCSKIKLPASSYSSQKKIIGVAAHGQSVTCSAEDYKFPSDASTEAALLDDDLDSLLRAIDKDETGR